jgi:hypothetical protein
MEWGVTRLTHGIPSALVDSKVEGRGRFRVGAGGVYWWDGRQSMVNLATVEMGVEGKNLAKFIHVSDIDWMVTNSGGLGNCSPGLRGGNE